MKTIAQQLKVTEFPFIINDSDGNEIYHEDSTGFWYKKEYDSDGNRIYYEDSDEYWAKYEYDSKGNEIYYENSDGVIEDKRPKKTLTQELLLDPELLQWAHQGKKHGTSRKGRRNITLGPLTLKTNDPESPVPSITVDVKSVTYTRLKDIPHSIIKSEGYKDLNELITSLKRFYPDCKLEDEFTLIEW